MKQSITLLALIAVVLSSCTSAYKTGQTPDDVYYSPVRKAAEYVEAEKKEEQPVQNTESYEDRFLRMRVTDPYRWSALDDYYFSNAYAYNSFGNYYSLNSPWNSYYAWNCHYNPYYGGMPYYPGGVIIIKNPKIYTPPSRALVFNPASYNVGGSSSSSTMSKGLNSSYYNRYNNNNRNSSNSLGQSIRKVFSGSSSSGGYNSGSGSSSPSRSYSPSSGSSSSSGGGGGSRSSGGGGGGVSRPSR